MFENIFVVESIPNVMTKIRKQKTTDYHTISEQ